MKPDKHKQKKQNEYKRKRGIQAKIEKTNNPNAGTRTPDVDRKEAVSEPVLTGSEFSELEAPSLNPQGHSYEPEPHISSDIEEHESGEELHEIIRDTANTLFQYQYHQTSFFDEIGNYPNISGWCSDIVSVCPNVMTKILLGIPLYERLNLEESIFEPKDIVRMQTEAGKCAHKTIPGIQLQKSCNDPSPQAIENLFNTIPTNTLKKKQNYVLQDSELKSEKTLHSSSTVSHEQNPTLNINTSIIDTTEHAISTPKPVSKPPINSLQTVRNVTIAELEDELDALLNL